MGDRLQCGHFATGRLSKSVAKSSKAAAMTSNQSVIGLGKKKKATKVAPSATNATNCGRPPHSYRVTKSDQASITFESYTALPFIGLTPC